ncbi:MAG: sodium-dependent transporter [Rhodothermaceae bacterium]|nr:sodium-dependent transporter [Rhodothermaceae bacterium]MYF40615.1 sodium-dependent transporter [Rhodothermaceae bacterium]
MGSVNGRGQWSGRLGFILAAAGSAIGLGNIWRFPYSVAEGGGGLFVLMYLIFVLAIGLPVLLAELSLGRAAQRNPVGAFKALLPGKFWPYVGGLGVVTGAGILAFYSVIAGWTVGYLGKAVSGELSQAQDGDTSAAIFTEFVADPFWPILLCGLFLLLTLIVVRRGVSKGIERAATLLMPALFVLLILLAIRAVTLPGGIDGLAYLFTPDWSKLSLNVVMGALGQALFSLSLGMGAMITFGSYMSKRENLWQSGIYVAIADTGIAILAGLIIFPALFFANADPSAGPGLVFVILPTIFNQMPLGTLFATLFFSLLAIAALTSTVSLLEVVVAYFVDEKGWTRNRAAAFVCGICFALAVPSALAFGAVSALSGGEDGILPFGLDFLTLNNNIWGNYSLSLGAFLICVAVGWVWGVPKLLAALEEGGDRKFPMPGGTVVGFLIKVICPLAVLTVLIFIIVTGQYF